jgi:hypothetical protein
VADWIGTALSRSGRSVLVVRAAERGGEPAPADAPALAQVLAGRAELDTLPLRALEGGFQVLPLADGTGDPGEALAAPGIADLVRQLATRFDHVVIEAPPVLPYVETALLAAQSADQVVLVVTPGWARRRQVRSAVAVLARQGAPLTLTVLARALRRGSRRPAGAEVPAAPLPEAPAPDAAPPVAAPLPTDPVLEADVVAGGEVTADEITADEVAADEVAAGGEPSDAGGEKPADTAAEPDDDADAEPDGEADAELDGDAEAELDSKADAEPDADAHAELDGGLDEDLDEELENELDADRPVLSGGAPSRGGDA